MKISIRPNLSVAAASLLLALFGLLAYTVPGGRAQATSSRRIIYQRINNSPPNDYTFHIANLDGTASSVAGQVEGEATVLARWSPDGTKIAWQVGDYWGGYDIYISDKDGSSASMQNITNTADTSEMYPLWQPGTDRLTYIADEGSVRSLYSMKSDGTDNHLLFDFPSTSTYTYSFSPDGTKIVFSNGTEGDSSIYIVNSDGTNLNELISGPSEGYSEPVFSPDGTKIALEYNSTTNSSQSALKVFNIDGSLNADLSAVQEAVGIPTTMIWAPDGLSLVFSSVIDVNNRNIFSVKIATGEVTRLTNRLYSNYPEFFSPDGTKVYFNSTDSATNNYGVFSTDLEGSVSQIIYQAGYDIALDEYSLEPEGNASNEVPDPGSEGGANNSSDNQGGTSGQGTNSPKPPRTGALLGAGIITVSLIILVMAVAQEVESKHLGKERSKNKFH